MKLKIQVVIGVFLISFGLVKAQKIIPINSGFQYYKIAPDGNIHLVSKYFSDWNIMSNQIVDPIDFSLKDCYTNYGGYGNPKLIFPTDSTGAFIENIPPGNRVDPYDINCESLFNPLPWNFINEKPGGKYAGFGGKVYLLVSNELLTINLESIIERRDTIQIPDLKEPEFVEFTPSGTLRVANFSDGKIFEIDTLGRLIHEYSTNLQGGNYFQKQGHYFSFNKIEATRYILTAVDFKGKTVVEVFLEDQCPDCIYNDFIFTKNEGIYLLGGIHQSDEYKISPWELISADRDILITKFDNSGQFIYSKTLDDDLYSEVVSGHLADNGDILLFANWNYNNHPGQLSLNRENAMIITDSDLIGFSDLESKNDFSVKNFTVSPNPATDYFTIQFETLQPKLELKLFDTQGLLIFTKSFSGRSITIFTDDLKNGFYYFTISNSNSSGCCPAQGKILINK